jgi:hypothetical protein
LRDISAAALAKITQKTGGEPLNIIEVQWSKNGSRHRYCDKSVSGLDGRIMSLEGIEDVINVSRSGTSQSVSVTLKDSDGHIKDIFNQTDIHQRKVWIYQWFSGLDIADRFLLFVGVISSPIVWKEGDRTLSFTVLSQTQDLEVGFSPEDGQFPNLPQSMVGTTWPLCFGTCVKVPLILVDEIAHNDTLKQGDSASAATEEPTGITDPSLEKQIADNDKNAAGLQELAHLYFLGYLQASFSARKRGEIDEFQSVESGSGTFCGLAKQYLNLGNKALLDSQRINRKSTALRSVKQEQEENQKDQILVTNGNLFPQNTSLRLNIGGALHTGYFIGNTFYITDRVHPANEKYEGLQIDTVDARVGFPAFDRDTFFFADSGQPLRVGSIQSSSTSDPSNDDVQSVRYIVAATIQVSVLSVVAYRTVNGFKQLTGVPSNFYSVHHRMFGTLPVTMLYLNQPLSTRNNEAGESEGWEDALWATVVSPIGPNTVDIMQWLISTYTDKTYDTTSFAAVRTLINPFPSHFAVLDRPNVLQLLSDIAYQSRCVIWLKNDVFYIKYLAQQDAHVDTITRADIAEQSLEVFTTETEELTTKLIAEWKPNYQMNNHNLIITKYNISYYGVQLKRVNWFIYNMQQLVQKGATFWLIREANTFKKVKFRTPLHKLRLETLDTVRLDFGNGIIANSAVDCVIEEANFNSSSYEIEFTCWVPVRVGEMTQYAFAYPANLSVEYVFPTPDDINQGRAGAGTDVSFNNNVTLPVPILANDDNVVKPFTGDQGNGGQIQVTTRPVSWGADPSYMSDLLNTIPEIIQRLDSTNISGIGKKPSGTTRYQYDKQLVKKESLSNPQTQTYPGFIQENNEDGTYTVQVHFKGLNSDFTEIKDVVAVDRDDGIEEGTAVIVSELFYAGASGQTVIEYYILASLKGKSVYPGYIQSGDEATGYTVESFPDGLDNESEIIEDVEILQANEDDSEFEEGTAVFVVEMKVTDPETEETVTKYYIQPAVWQ